MNEKHLHNAFSDFITSHIVLEESLQNQADGCSQEAEMRTILRRTILRQTILRHG